MQRANINTDSVVALRNLDDNLFTAVRYGRDEITELLKFQEEASSSLKTKSA